MFDDSKCNECENVDCLTKCQWIEFDGIDDARSEMTKMINGEESRVLSECVTCFACHEYCPYGSNPFDLITTLQEKHDSLEVNEAMRKRMIAMYKPHDEFKPWDGIEPDKSTLNKCAFIKTNADDMKGEFFEDLQSIGGRDFFCNLLYHHIARDSVIRERVPIILENLEKQGVKEMICFHDECYGLYNSYIPRNNFEIPQGLKPIHVFEYVYNYLKENESKIQKLNIKAAYQRNCSTRFNTEIDEYVDKICELIGVERVDREFDRENALCCGGPLPMLGKKKLMRETQNKNIKDMLDHNAEVCFYNCPMCMETMGSKVERKGLKNYLLTNLCRKALGENIE
ncbi:MAG: (Fe-S)-binding protein [Candidatus Lokiarchaeota archaeon]|nr:(Fe-S)-binding protein [Candidatus Lokiarchaeota archaeon]MBD3198895.1 (Fe-S)-binding protein [Candidatus Lokiarchaeota archaeon]